MKKIFLSGFLVSIFSLCNTYSESFQVSATKRFILKDNKPFFWKGDTAWEMFHRLDREDVEYYQKRRAAQKFTVIQAVALAEFDCLREKNDYSEIPLINEDPATPDAAYFKLVKIIIDKTNESGLNVRFLPTWDDQLNKIQLGTVNTGIVKISKENVAMFL